MHAGEIVQVGAPRAVYARPVNKVVADFMGLVNLISGRVVRAGADGAGSVPGRVVEATFLGNLVDCHVALADGTRVRIQVDPGQTLEVGQCVGIRFDGRLSSVFG
jgi:iron(III) transport system ATP-binding protein